MAIVRSPRSRNFTVIDNATLADGRLSWAARGLLVYLLSKPDDWCVSPKQLINAGTAGRDAVYGYLAELETVGYAAKSRARKTGQFAGYDWVIYDSPRAAAPCAENPDTAPHPENPDMAREHASPDAVGAGTVSGKPGHGEATVSGLAVSGKSGNILKNHNNQRLNSSADARACASGDAVGLAFGDVVQLLQAHGTPHTWCVGQTSQDVIHLWVQQGVTTANLTEALARAHQRKRGECVGPRYLHPIVLEVIAGRAGSEKEGNGEISSRDYETGATDPARLYWLG